MNDERLLRTLTLLLAVAEQALLQIDGAAAPHEETRAAVVGLTEQLQHSLPHLSRAAA